MTLSLEGLKYELFGNDVPVPPGHPLCLAYLIMHKYGSLAEARARPTVPDLYAGPNPPAALSDSDIPGAGGTVWAALDMLRYAETASLDVGVMYANDYWKSSELRSGNEWRFEAGQRQADGIESAFRAKAKQWCGQAIPK